MVPEPLSCGSSPLARGTPVHAGGGSGCSRFIPAGAGNTKCGQSTVAGEAVHPRWRGEHARLLARHQLISGSSPLARGTLLVGGGALLHGRFIPAGAGNTLRSLATGAAVAVHPRWRGEHTPGTPRRCSSIGSSPLARGTLDAVVAVAHVGRFIPAGAGNTYCKGLTAPASPVHPRWRGEHFSPAAASSCSTGSSPLARGILAIALDPAESARFIPAGAGNTARTGSRRDCCAVHPRWRGEHPKLSR